MGNEALGGRARVTTPLFFGTSQRRLFGLYIPPRRRVPAPKSIVLCHPWGQEYLRAQRSMRQLGQSARCRRPPRVSVRLLRHGDSAGDMVDADLAGWERDIEMATQELRDTSGATRVSLAGCASAARWPPGSRHAASARWTCWRCGIRSSAGLSTWRN